MGKTRDHFKKIGDIKGASHARMSMIRDRDGKNITSLMKRVTRGIKNAQKNSTKRS